MRVTMIVNPRAGRRKACAAASVAAALLREAGWAVEVLHTEAAGQAEALARQAAASGAELVVACGGDGTVSEVLNGLQGKSVSFGLIPCGSGNDFARMLGLPRDPTQAAQRLLQGSVRPVDVLSLQNGRLALNIIGVGFDAAVARKMNRYTRGGGGLTSYLLAVLMELAAYKLTSLRLQVDAEVWEGKALLVAVANAQSYGAGMKVAPKASVEDGLLDVVLVEPLGRLQFLRALPKLFSGKHLDMPQVHYWQGREAKIETAQLQPVLVDGDLRGETPLAVRILPAAGLFWR